MNKWILALPMLTALLLTACGGAPTATPTATPTRLMNLRIELPSDVDVADVPRLMAADTFREMGYQIEPLDFTDNTLSVEALVNGTSDFGYVGTGLVWAAIEKGGKIASIVDGTINPASLVGRGTIQKCQDLNGTRVAMPSLSSNRSLMLNKYVKKYCPEIKYEPVVIQTQSAMIAALQAGQIDAGVLDYSTLMHFQQQTQTDLHSVVRFSKEFPGLIGAGGVTRRELIEKYPETVRDYFRAILLARRKLQDPQAMEDAFIKYLKLEPAEAKAEAEIFSKENLWDLNGGYTSQALQENMEFLIESGVIDTGMKTTDVADLKPLNAVLDEIGRK